MANESLKYEVNSLQSQLNDINSQNQELTAQCVAARGAMDEANSELRGGVDEVRSRLGGANGGLASAHQRMVDASAIQSQIDGLYRNLKQMELANKRIRECNNTKYYDFVTYRTVRKIVQGVMDNLDFSMVSEETIERAVEHSELDNPEFWLTAALMAVIAWRADQPERAHRALDRALHLDERKTAAFFMIFTIRMHRESTALKWFRVLTRHSLTGNDRMLVLLFFSMITHTLEEDVSEETRRTMQNYVNRLFDEGMGGERSRQDAVQRICQAYLGFIQHEDRAFGYEALNQYVPSRDGLVDALAGARGTASIIDFIVETLTVDEQRRNEFLKYYIDEVVDEPCAVEQGVYDEIERNELIIKHHGDVDAAQEEYHQRKKESTSNLDIIFSIVDWVFVPSKQGEANPQMRRNMLVLSQPLQQQAAQMYIDRYRAAMTPKQHVQIRDFEADTDVSKPDMVKQQAAAHYQALAAEGKKQIKPVGPIVLLIVGVVAGVCLGVFVNPFLSLVGVAIAGAAGIWFAVNAAKRKRVDERCAANIQSANAEIDRIHADWTRLAEDFHQEDLRSQQLLDKLVSMGA